MQFSPAECGCCYPGEKIDVSCYPERLVGVGEDEHRRCCHLAVACGRSVPNRTGCTASFVMRFAFGGAGGVKKQNAGLPCKSRNGSRFPAPVPKKFPILNKIGNRFPAQKNIRN